MSRNTAGEEAIQIVQTLIWEPMQATARQSFPLFLNLYHRGPSDFVQGINLPFSGGRYEHPDCP